MSEPSTLYGKKDHFLFLGGLHLAVLKAYFCLCTQGSLIAVIWELFVVLGNETRLVI